jgi:Concanavalin A-like lectin/glucanases superfamily
VDNQLTRVKYTRCLPLLKSWAFSCTVVLILVVLSACSKAGPSTTTPLPFADDFSNPSSGWQTLSDISADVKYDAGKLHLVIKQENLTQWSLAGKLFQDATYEAEAQPNGGPTDNGFGILFRVKDRKNFYHFEISSDGYWRAGVMKNGTWDNWDDWAASDAIKTGNAVNHLKVTMQGDTFTFFVNDQQVLQKQDASFPNGDIGVFALTLIDKPGTDISFDNVSVTEIKKDSGN